MTSVLNTDDALAVIRQSVSPVGTITVSLQQSLGSVLAENIIARENVPPFDNSSMDGFAVRVEDIREVPAVLSITGEVSAGEKPASALESHEAVRIMTGAKIPDGCTAVVQREWTETIGATRVKILRRVNPGHNIRAAGGDIRSGTCVLERGRLIRPQEIGVLASLGERFVSVYREPRVAILTTGNEILELDAPRTEGTIRNSNRYVLEALVRQSGCDGVMLGAAKDDMLELREKILAGVQYDVMITSGGVSAGKFDLVIDAMKECGIEIKFWKVNIRPGMPLVFGMHGTTPVFGLPGNPVSTMVTFLEFVRPALTIMRGGPPSPVRLRAILAERIEKPDGKRHFIRGVLENRDGSLSVRTTGSQVSNMLTSLVKANCLIILPESTKRFSVGEAVDVELL